MVQSIYRLKYWRYRPFTLKIVLERKDIKQAVKDYVYATYGDHFDVKVILFANPDRYVSVVSCDVIGIPKHKETMPQIVEAFEFDGSIEDDVPLSAAEILEEIEIAEKVKK